MKVNATFRDFNAQYYSERHSMTLKTNKDGIIELGALEGVSTIGL